MNGTLAPYLPLEAASRSDLNRAWRTCSRIARRAAGNFYLAFLILPPVQRRGIEALYAFCRAGDDAADFADGSAEAVQDSALISQLRNRLDTVYTGQYCDDTSLALAVAVRRFSFERKHFDDLLEGLASDLDFRPFPTRHEQELYCYRVASTVGLLCLHIFGVVTEAARGFAVDLGKAMQLTNILRDIGEDQARGRVYIPIETLARHGLTPSNFLQLDYRAALHSLVAEEAAFARRFYRQAREALTPDIRGPLTTARAMGAIYEALLGRIESTGRYDRRIRLTRGEKVAIIRSLTSTAAVS
ncbi:MAG: phytoene/squalene synthase family protein [Calditrichaeota bacterium]|nr:phytoene/squalene synthase family protein [Calditrichota bacterium]